MDTICASDAIELKRGTTDDIPVTLLNENDTPVTGFTGRLWFMVKEDLSDPDDDAIISKEITVLYPDGVPSHGVLALTLEDSANPAGNYVYDLKKKEGSDDWKSTDVGTFIISPVVRFGNPS